jgi:hypothetical protein
MIKNDIGSDLVMKTGYFAVAGGAVVFVLMLLLTLIHS